MLTSFVSSYHRVLISIENNDIILRRRRYVIRRETRADFNLPPFSKRVRTFKNKEGTRWLRESSSCSKRVRYAHVSCFNFPTHPHQNTIGFATHDGCKDETDYNGVTWPRNIEMLELVTVSKRKRVKGINGTVTPETNGRT